jgi:hypothetical protein
MESIAFDRRLVCDVTKYISISSKSSAQGKRIIVVGVKVCNQRRV